MPRIISAIASIVWGVLIGLGALAAMMLHANGNAASDPERLFVGLTMGGIPLVAGILALAMRWSAPLIASWALLAGMVIDKIQLDLSKHSGDPTHWIMLALTIVGLIVSVLSSVNRETAGERQTG